MSQINPFAGAILQSSNVQRQVAADRDKQLRKAADSAKNAYLTEDRLELSVESSDPTEEAGDERRRREQPDKRKSKPQATSDADDDDERLDIRA